MKRLQKIQHNGVEIYQLDFRHANSREILQLMDECKRVVTSRPRGSVLTLSLFEGGDFTREAITRMKEVAAYDRPYVRRAAFVGAEHLPKVYYESLQRFSQRDFVPFETREEALEWLTNEEATRSQPAGTKAS